VNKCIFLDRDGVLNVERGTYTWKIEDFEIISGVKEALFDLKNADYKLVVVTNQAGISKGLFTKNEMDNCHEYLVSQTGNVIDDFYYSMYHTEYSNSLLRKPDSLMFEKAIAKYHIDPLVSWMIGNHERDLIPARKLGLKTIFIGEKTNTFQADFYTGDLRSAANHILKINPIVKGHI
jgi:D-glycero-D-manno-heptose 1,7-bisphosphate phosphatase